MGPGAGHHGGQVVAADNPKYIQKMDTDTAAYLTGKKQIAVPEKRRSGNGKKIQLKGCTGNNLKNVDLNIPLGSMIGVTGVSGSGKSTLINETLYPILNQHFFNAVKKPLPYTTIK